jgi:predicted dienelactone hydrolase
MRAALFRMILATTALLSSPAAALEATAPVGTASIAMNNSADGRQFVSEFWFAAAPGSKVEAFAVRPPLRAIPIARGAEPAPAHGKRPLIVISHGNWGTRYSQGWLALRLVQAGYLVLSTSHPGTLGNDQSVAGRLRLWDRSRDVSFALTQILAQPQWSGLIDESRVGFVGHSFGGWTGVSLAGGRFDALAQRASCEKAAKKDFYCTGTLTDEIAGIPIADAGESFKDGRFKAFYIMASGPAQGFSEASLRTITAPFVIDTAQADEILDAAVNSTTLARRIPSATEVVRPVGHFAYVPECKWAVGPLLARLAGTPICDDPPGVDRGLVHKQVAEDVAAFFARQLPATGMASRVGESSER